MKQLKTTKEVFMNNTVKDIMTCIDNLIMAWEDDLKREGYSLDIDKYHNDGPMGEKELLAQYSMLLLMKDQIERAIEENEGA